MRVWVDIEDAAGAKLGPGPLRTAAGWEYTWRLNQAGSWTFSVPALDPKCDLIRLGRVARAWTVREGKVLPIGGGRIEKREIEVGPGPVMLQVEGDDLLRELANRTVGNLALNQTVISHPAYCQFMDTDGTPTATPLLNVNDGPVGDTDSYDNFVLDGDKFFWEIYDPAPFARLRVVLGTAKNAFACGLNVFYWDGAAWTEVPDVSDGTAVVAGTPFAQSGDISFDAPDDWAPMTDGTLYGLRVTVGGSGAEDIDVTDVALVRTQPCTDALAKIMALVAGEWQLDAVLGYTSITAATEVGDDELDNGDFETITGTADDGTSDTFGDWTNSGVDDGSGNKIEATLTHTSGSRAVKITNTTAAPYLYQDVAVAEGTTYRLTWWTRGDGTQNARVRVEDRSHTGAAMAQYLTALVPGVASTTWTQITVDFTAPIGCTLVRVALHGSAGAGVVYGDLVSVCLVLGRSIDMQCAGESILEMLSRVAQETGEFFTLSPGGGRSVLWLRTDLRNSGLRALSPSTGVLSGDAVTETALIINLTQIQNRYELATRVYPRNQSLAFATTSLPAGWTLDKTANCLIYDTAETALGRIDKALDVAVLAPAGTAADQYRSNLVLAQCYDWLRRHSATDTHPLTGDVPCAYALTLAKCHRWVVPGYQVRVVYHKWREGYHAVGIDALLYILSATVRVDVNGFHTVRLEVGSAPEQPVSGDAERLVQELQASRAARARA